MWVAASVRGTVGFYFAGIPILHEKQFKGEQGAPLIFRYMNDLHREWYQNKENAPCSFALFEDKGDFTLKVAEILETIYLYNSNENQIITIF